MKTKRTIPCQSIPCQSIPCQNKTKKKGGKTFSTGDRVSLSLKTKTPIPILCDICKQNDYEEVLGTTNKSKARDLAGVLVFGEGFGNIDNTSIIQYFCNICGYCKIFRNKPPLKITASKI